MPKVVLKKLKSNRSAKATAKSVGKKRVSYSRGKWVTVRTLDANSATFDRDLHYVFGRNVAKARRDNKRTIGLTDIAPRKA